MTKLEELIGEFKQERFSIGAIIDDRSLHNIPNHAYVRAYEELSNIIDVLETVRDKEGGNDYEE